jgi:hypothetical protein
MKTFKQFISESAIYKQLEDARDIDDPVDRAIAMYTIDSMYKYEINDVIEDAIEKYPNSKPVTLYRGMNFAKKEEYDLFMNDMNDGKVKFNDCSSWTPRKATAEQFARTRPTYMEFMSRNMWDEISAQNSKNEKIRGYRGIILSTNVEAGRALDISLSSYARESEMILPSGEYKVEAIDEIKTFKDDLANSDVNAEIAKMKLGKSSDRNKDQDKFLEYLIQHHKDDFSDASKSKIFKLMSFDKFRYEIEIVQQDRWNFTKHPTIGVASNARHLDSILNMESFLLPEDLEKVKNTSRPEVLKLFKDIRKNYKEGYVIDWRNEYITDIVKKLDLQSEYISLMRDTVGETYRNTTSREHNRKIVTQDDVRKEADRILSLLKSIG